MFQALANETFHFPVIHVAPPFTRRSSSRVRGTESDCGSVMEDEHKYSRKNVNLLLGGQSFLIGSKNNTGDK